MLTFQNTISIGDLLNVAFLSLTIVGIFLTVRQLRHSQETQRATFLKELYLTLFGDPNIREAFYLIDQDKLNYETGGFKDSPHEQLIDQLLIFADLVCGLYERKMLTRREMNFFRYQFIRIYENKKIQDYLTFLEGIYKQKEAATTPFASFVMYCKQELGSRSPHNLSLGPTRRTQTGETLSTPS